MSTMQRMTLIGLYNYEQTFDRDLFVNLSLPEGYDKPTFINSLLLEHGEKCVLYTDPDFFMQAIGMWSSKYSLELSRIHEALTAEYNPIWNYDRYEDWSDESGGRKASETAGNRSDTSETEGGRKSSSETTGEHTDESTTNAGRRSTSATDNSARNESETAATSNKKSATSAGHKAQDQQNYNDTTTNDYDVTTTSITDAETEHQVSADNSGSYQPEWKETHDGGQNKVENDGTIGRHIEGTTQNLVESTDSKTNETGADKSKTVEVGSGHTTTNESGIDNSKTAGSAADNSKTIEFGVDNSKTTGSATDNSKTVESSADKSKHLGHLWGNIGVTTSAAMVEEVVAQRFKISLYGTAAKMFANELLIGIW